MSGIDLHAHSTFSDGTYTPKELVCEACKIGLSALALTDHDTLDGLDAAQEEAQKRGLFFVRGVEFSTLCAKGEVHILGLFVPRESASLDEHIAFLHAKRRKRNLEMLERLADLGLPLSEEDVLATVVQGSVGRPHIAQAMVQKGYVPNIRAAFTQYIGAGCKAFVPKKVFSTEEAVRVLHGCGATTSLAHPGLYSFSGGFLRTLLRSLVKEGLDAIEAYHSEHNTEQSSYFARLAAEFGLICTGGSDFHGARKPGVFLGIGRGNLAVPEDVLFKLLARRKSQGLEDNF